ncbi:MAG TPA: site-specific integrase, partial [Flavisolibacter sp.]|nr:site-specific integrase [Flavisolibacter sp.]
MENQQATQEFLNYIKFEKRYSQHTITSYQTDLTYFFDYLVCQYGEIKLPDISHIYIRSWLASLKDEKQNAKTINRKISTLKSFFKYLVKTGVISQSPMAKIIAPKNDRRLPNFVSDKDIKKLFDQIEFPNTWKGCTERLTLLIFYHTGMRLSEVISIDENQINFSNHSIKVLGKGNKE